jgi:undecaprenyl-diphosphatase
VFGVFNSEHFKRLLYPQSLAVLLTTTVIVTLLAILIRLKETYALDLAATKGLQTYESPWATRLATWATWMGNSLTIILLCVGVVIIALIGQQGTLVVLAPFTLLSLGINVIVKNMVDRKRPGETEAKIHPGPRWGFSYPSGHSMGAAAFYGFLAFVCWFLVPGLPLRVLLVSLFALLPLLVGLSRVYLGAHWLSDVLGGWAGGLFVAVPLALLYQT